MDVSYETGSLALVTGRETRRPSGQSAADVVHRDLRREIVSMVRLPGAPIAEKEIAAAHGVSRTPVREALLRLADERLVEITPKSGTCVSRIPVPILSDAFCAREALESMLVGKAATRARSSAVTAMRALVERQHELVEAGDSAGFHEADEAFHFAVAEAAGHPGVWAMVLQIKVQLDRVRRLTLPRLGRLEDVVLEHEAVVDGIASGDPDRAVTAMRAHIRSLRVVLGEIRHLNPDYFVGDLDDVEG